MSSAHSGGPELWFSSTHLGAPALHVLSTQAGFPRTTSAEESAYFV